MSLWLAAVLAISQEFSRWARLSTALHEVWLHQTGTSEGHPPGRRSNPARRRTRASATEAPGRPAPSLDPWNQRVVLACAAVIDQLGIWRTASLLTVVEVARAHRATLTRYDRMPCRIPSGEQDREERSDGDEERPRYGKASTT